MDEIIWLADVAITSGWSGPVLPAGPITRGQMATFLYRRAGPARDLKISSLTTRARPRGRINRVAKAGIATGCSETVLSPDPVTRGQMATFLARGLGLRQPTTDYFTDDTGGSRGRHQPHRRGRHHPGCAPTRFCPDGIVIRQVMAAFLFRALAP